MASAEEPPGPGGGLCRAQPAMLGSGPDSRGGPSGAQEHPRGQLAGDATRKLRPLAALQAQLPARVKMQTQKDAGSWEYTQRPNHSPSVRPSPRAWDQAVAPLRAARRPSQGLPPAQPSHCCLHVVNGCPRAEVSTRAHGAGLQWDPLGTGMPGNCQPPSQHQVQDL